MSIQGKELYLLRRDLSELILHSLEARKSTSSEPCNMEPRGITPTGVCNVRPWQASL